jgi:hypothetical protein
MDMWLGLVVVLIVVVLSYFTPRRKCAGSCQDCGSSCNAGRSDQAGQPADQISETKSTSAI